MAPRLFACFGKRSSSSTQPQSVEVIAEEEVRLGGPVLVELFSSQGCATSPAAEVLVSRLGRGDFALQKQVIILAFHVDYWDYAGWKDPYGSILWTTRQKAYVEALKLDTMFTPQVVVQGRSHCVGNDEEALLSNIMASPSFPSPSFQATFVRQKPDTLQVTLTGQLRMKIENNGANVMVALYESGLVNDCPRGENTGRVLSNDYVVRKLEKLSTVKNVSAKKTVSGTLNFGLWDAFNGSKCGLAIFVQDSSYRVFGSQNIDLPNDI